MIMYKPTEEGKYNLPILDTEDMIVSLTIRDFIDVYVANYGHDVNHDKLMSMLEYMKKIIFNDAKETLELCEKEIIKEIEKR